MENIYSKGKTLIDLVGAATVVIVGASAFLVDSGGLGVGAAMGDYFVAAGFSVSAKIAASELGALLETGIM